MVHCEFHYAVNLTQGGNMHQGYTYCKGRALYQESLEARCEAAFARKKPWKNGKTKEDGGGENMHNAL